jgi:import receptor subunit TOM70
VAARLQIAILYARYGLYEDAEIAFEALDELAPNNSAVKTNQGNLYFLQQDFQNAEQQYRRALELDDKDGGIWINLSMAQYKSGDLKQARNSYQNALQLDAGLKDEYSAYSKLLSN